jgi:hypothetical protein
MVRLTHRVGQIEVAMAANSRDHTAVHCRRPAAMLCLEHPFDKLHFPAAHHRGEAL